MKIFLYKIFIISSLFAFLPASAQNITYANVHAMPQSIEKDYYIWRLLSKPSTTRAQALSIGKEVKRSTPKLRTAYKKKTHLNLPATRKIRTAKERQRKQRLTKELRRVFGAPNPFAKWLSLPAYKQVELFNSAGKNARKKLNHTLTKAQWNRLIQVPQFNKSIRYIKSEKLKYLQRGFTFPISKSSRLNGKNSMILAFAALRRGNERMASSYFIQATKYPEEREDLDAALFWLYLITKKRIYLDRVLKSYDVNIYTLSARDIAKMPYPKTISPRLPMVKRLNNSAYLEPIYWVQIKKQAKNAPASKLTNLANQYKSANTIGYYTWLMSRASKDVKQYFPMPYRSTIRGLPPTRQALLYAIARQESRFVPGSISTSYALGLMQIMPFLVKDLAKQRHERVDYDDMFNPVIALKYANTHMNYLNKWLQHPLFVAYAYNAGIGYTKRMLKRGNLFRGRSKYDPYMSIELLDNDQARRYGKHVLANYVIYMNKLGVPVRLSAMLRLLHVPARTDKFRR